MSKNEILEGNKFIAEFIGLKRGWWIHQEKPLTDDKKQWCDLDGKTFLGTRAYYDKDLIFHTSWDWLMPVVEKIRVIENGDGGRYTFNWKDYKVWFSKWQDGSGIISECCMISGTTPIQAIYESVVEFIKWYNEQSKQL